MTPCEEKHTTLTIYWCLTLLSVLDPIFSPLITEVEILSTTFIRLLELSIWLYMIYNLANYYAQGGNAITKCSSFFLIILLGIISIYIILQGEWTSAKKIAFDLSGNLMTYLLPFIILSLPNERYHKKIFRVFFYGMLFVFPIWILNFSRLIQDDHRGESIGIYLPFYAGFFLSLRKYFSNKEYVTILLVWGIYFLLMLLNARRNVTLSLTMYAMIAIGLTFTNDNSRKIKQILLACLCFTACFVTLNFERLSDTLLERVLERGTEDTRSGVEELFLLDFVESPRTDWILGRGIDGTYAQQVINEETGEVNDERPTIETGYLNMLLKGGGIYIFAILSILFSAVFNGLKKQKLLYTFLSLFLLTYIIDLYTTLPINNNTARSVLFWFSISLCLTKEETSQHRKVYLINKYIKELKRRKAISCDKTKDN